MSTKTTIKYEFSKLSETVYFAVVSVRNKFSIA